MRIRIIAAICAALLIAAACSGDDENNAQPSTTPAPASSTTGSTPETTAPDKTTTTDAFPTTSLPCQTVPPPNTPVTSVAPSGAVYLTNVEETGDGCVDHVVFEFTSKDASAPGYEITYGTPPFTEPGSGDPITVNGRSFITVKIAPGYGYDFEADQPTYTGPKRITPTATNHVREIVQIGDFEGELTWAIGLDRKRPFTVQATLSPRVQLAVTVG